MKYFVLCRRYGDFPTEDKGCRSCEGDIGECRFTDSGIRHREGITTCTLYPDGACGAGKRCVQQGGRRYPGAAGQGFALNPSFIGAQP